MQPQSRQSCKPRPDDSVLHPKHTQTVLGVIPIVSRLYDLKLSRSNFEDFYGSVHHWSRFRAGKVENRARMTQFSTRKMPTLFGCISYRL